LPERRKPSGAQKIWIFSMMEVRMGYVNDTHMSQFIPPSAALQSAGTWTAAAASNVWSSNRTAADAAWVTYIPIPIPSNSAGKKGAYLVSVTVYFSVGTAALDSLAAAVYKDTLAVDGTLTTAAAVTTTYDTGHDSAAERIDVDVHTLTLTLATPAWIAEDEAYHVELSGDAAATSVFKYFGAVANYTLRV
jgi:hypothetical protein